MVQLKYFGDSRDFFKYDLITQILDDTKIENYVFVPMLTRHRIDNEGKKTPIKNGDKSEDLHSFIGGCDPKSLNHWEKWLSPHVKSYMTVEPVDESYFEDQNRDSYWITYAEYLKQKNSLIFLDPDTGLQSGSNSYLKKIGREKYILNYEIKLLHEHLDHSSALMIYQHLPNNKNEHVKSVYKKMAQLKASYVDSFVCGYREDDLVFLFLTKKEELFKSIYSTLTDYYSKSVSKYKSLHVSMKPPYLVSCRHGGERVGVLAFKHKKGAICFLDVGWLDTAVPPFHILDGPFELVETPRGMVYTAANGDTVQELKPEHPLWYNWQNWLDFLENPDGAKANQDIAIEGCKSNGAIIDQPL